jgi:hypothetical protein
MIPLFLGLSALNLLCLCTTAVIGYISMPRANYGGVHFLVGVLSTFACCGVHCVVFTYFVATAKWVQHAISVKQLDPALLAPTRSFKAQALPAALVAMGVVFVTAMLGAAKDNYGIAITYHHFAAILSVAINLWAAAIEMAAIRRNGELIDLILAAPHASTPAKAS